MFAIKKCVFILWFSSTLSFKTGSQNETAEFLWKLYNFALQSKQTHSHYPYPYSYKYPGKYPEYYQNYPINTYGHYSGSTYGIPHDKKKPYSKKLPNQGYFPSKPTHSYGSYPSPNPYPTIPPSFSNTKESIMEVMHSIARNDDLHCVPKLICEVTSGTISGRQQGVNLPININMESLLGFVSSLNGAQSSPLLYFGKAALLGFASKGNTGSCNYAYPECPTDPDKVVKYLNNHNGGFFRFFGDIPPTQNYPQSFNQVPYWKKLVAEQRIQNNAVDYTPSNTKYHNSITFPRDDEELIPNFNSPQSFRSEKAFTFPSRDFIFNNELTQSLNDFSPHSSGALQFPNDDENYEHVIRNPKKLSYTNYELDTDIQKPLPNHKATPMIFPDRTGTGDLKLDPEEFQEYGRPVSYQYDGVRIAFNEVKDDGLNFHAHHNRNGRGFSFPPR